jgi:hypothetical protein
MAITSEPCSLDVEAAILTNYRFGTDMVVVRVGRNSHARDFAVYEKLVRQSSAFINNALKEPWKESTDRIVCLPEFRSETFDAYHLWLLTGKLHCKQELADDTEDPKQISSVLYGELLNLKDLSRLGHYLLDAAFTDRVCDAILQCCQDLNSAGERFPASYGFSFYSAIPQGSPTRSLIANVVTYTAEYVDVVHFKDVFLDAMHSDFIMDVLQAMAKRWMKSDSSPTSPLWEPEASCKYHSHGDHTICYKKKDKGYVPRRSIYLTSLTQDRLLSPDKKRPAPADGESLDAKRQR